jgi:outer membrane biosynthesis protein TonB
MKTLLALLFFGLISTSTIFAQESADVADEMNQFLSKNLRYPTEARSNGIQGTVILQATFD